MKMIGGAVMVAGPMWLLAILASTRFPAQSRKLPPLLVSIPPGPVAASGDPAGSGSSELPSIINVHAAYGNTAIQYMAPKKTKVTKTTTPTTSEPETARPKPSPKPKPKPAPKPKSKPEPDKTTKKTGRPRKDKADAASAQSREVQPISTLSSSQ